MAEELSWRAVWFGLERDAQAEVLLGLFDEDLEPYRPQVLRRLARRINFRPQTLFRMPRNEVLSLLARCAPEVIEPSTWAALFAVYYLRRHAPLLCRFLDRCGIPHDGRGVVVGEIEPVAGVEEIAEALVEEFGREAVWRYFSVLCLQSGHWAFLMPVVETLSQSREAPVEAPEVQQDLASAGAVALDEAFCQLDRVLIDQVVACAAGSEGSLAPPELLDLVESVLALNGGRERSYFHLGFMDALIPGREADFSRPEFNDGRRQWYLAGLLAGYARQRRLDAIDRLLAARRDDFQRAADRCGGAGRCMAQNLLAVLYEEGREVAALRLLRGQVTVLGARELEQVLWLASEALRQGEAGSAKAVLQILYRALGAWGEDPRWTGFSRRVRRKLGQACQALGEITRARELFEGLVEESPQAEWLADLALVEAGFRTLQEVCIGAQSRRDSVREALSRVEARLQEAVAQDPEGAPHGRYLLAVLRYLEFTHDGEDADGLREEALQHAEQALSAVLDSPHGEAFERLGVVDELHFIIAVARMMSADVGQLPSAMRAWRAIRCSSRRFPLADLGRLLEWAQLMDDEGAVVEIAETLWRDWGEKALEVLLDCEGTWSSRTIQVGLREMAQDGRRPREQRFRWWSHLILKWLQQGEVGAAREGLDALEGLALEDTALARRFSNWLDEVELDPAWDAVDLYRARYRLYRRLGEDELAWNMLQEWFYAVRDRDPAEAMEVRESLRVSGAPEERWQSLRGVVEEAASAAEDDVEAVLREGAEVRVLFVGGNETQARYDEAVRRAVAADWPGVEVEFVHTGWSSNWGEELERVKRRAREADVVVLMTMMRTLLGRHIREALNDPPRPWVSCVATGKRGMERSIRRAVRVALAQRMVTA